MATPFDPAYPGRPVSRFVPNPKLRFLEQCREVLRFKPDIGGKSPLDG